MTTGYKQLGIAKTVLAFFLAGPPMYGLVHAVLDLVMVYWHGPRPNALLSAVSAWGQLLAIEMLFIFGLFDEYAWKFLYLPTFFAGSVFWSLCRQIAQHCSFHSKLQRLFANATLGSLVSVAAFITVNSTLGTIEWKDLYFYQPQDKTVRDYSEWGFLDAYGLLFHWTCIASAGFGLGLFFGPKAFKKSDDLV